MSKRKTLVNSTLRTTAPTPSVRWVEVLGEIVRYNNQWSPRTREDWVNDMQRFLYWLGARPISKDTIEAYLQEMRDNGGSDWLIVRHKVRIEWLCRDLVRMGYMRFVPKIDRQYGRTNCKNKKRGYTYEEYCKLRDNATHDISILCVVLFATGLSLVDGSCLQWENVDLKNMMIRRHRHKLRGKKVGDCRIPLINGSDLHRLLLRQLQGQPSPDPKAYVFPELVRRYYRKNGEPHREDKKGKSLVDDLRNECKRIGVEHLGTHSFRRGLLTELVSKDNSNLIKVMQISGHSCLETLSEYVKIPDEAIKDEAAETMRRYFTERHTKVQNVAEVTHDSNIP